MPPQRPGPPPQPRPQEKYQVFEQWKTMNANPLRAGLPDDQAYWLENVMPWEARALVSLPGPTETETVLTNDYVLREYAVNMYGTQWLIGFTATGAGWMWRVGPFAGGAPIGINPNGFQFAPPGTFTTTANAPFSGPDLTQWEDQVCLISDPNHGYMGLNQLGVLSQAGGVSINVAVLNEGSGYQGTPVAWITGGSGAGAQIRAVTNQGSVIRFDLLAPGSGYLPTDTLTLNITPPSAVATTNAATAPTSNALSFAALPEVYPGETVTDTSAPGAIATGTSVLGISGAYGSAGFVYLSQNVASTVNSGDVIFFGNPPVQVLRTSAETTAQAQLIFASHPPAYLGEAVGNKTNPGALGAGSTVTAISGNTVTLSAPLQQTVQVGDLIMFGGAGASATAIGFTGNGDTTVWMSWWFPWAGVGATIMDQDNPKAFPPNTTITGFFAGPGVLEGVALGGPYLTPNFYTSNAAQNGGVSWGDTILFYVNTADISAISFPSNELIFAATVPPTITVGQSVTNLTNPSSIASGTYVKNVNGNIIVLSQSVVSNVNVGDTIEFGNPNGVQATGQAHVWPSLGFNPVSLDVYQGRVWIGGRGQGSTRVVQVTGTGPVVSGVTIPGYDDFAVADAATTFGIPDADMVNGISAIRAKEGYLYIFGFNCIKQIGAVSVSGTQTLFTLTTISSDQGTPWPQSVLSFNRLVCFANPNGIFSIYGSSIQKISGPVDYLFNYISYLFQQSGYASPSLSMAIHDFAGKRMLCCMAYWVNPQTNTPRPFLVCFSEKAWFIYSPSATLTGITTVNWASQAFAFCFDAIPNINPGQASSKMYIAMGDPTLPLPITIGTALSDCQAPMVQKRVVRGGISMAWQAEAYTASVTFQGEVNQNLVGVPEIQDIDGSTIGSYAYAPIQGETSGLYVGVQLQFTPTGTLLTAPWPGVILNAITLEWVPGPPLRSVNTAGQMVVPSAPAVKYWVDEQGRFVTDQFGKKVIVT